jgi:hypothetical protein
VSRVVRLIAEGHLEAPSAADRNMLMGALAIIGAEQKWYYLMQLCVPALLKDTSSDSSPMDDDTLCQFLTFGHRINDALCLKIHGREALAERLSDSNMRLPARRWNIPWTDRWVSPDTIYAMIVGIHLVARRIPKVIRHRWVAGALRRRCSRLNARMMDAVDFNLMRHMMATGIQWKRLAKSSEDEALHLRLHYASGILSVAIQSKGIAKSKRTILPIAIEPFLSDEERPHIDRHFALRWLSMRIFDTLWRLRDKGDIGELKGILHYFYVLLLHESLNDPDVVMRLSEMGDYPTIVITAHGGVGQLPYSALFDGERYLGERFNIVQAAPLFPDGEFEEGELDFEAVSGGEPITNRQTRVLAGGERLPQIEFEVADLQALSAAMDFPLEVWPDNEGDWTADTIKWLFETNGIALLSAHVLASPQNATEAVIVAPKGQNVSFGEAVPPHADIGLLMLSGCQSTGFTDWLAPNESSIVSFCRKSGAQSVVSSLWPIRDYPARLYNLEMIAGLNRGLTRAAAHGAALRHVMSASASLGQLHSGERLIRKPQKAGMELRSASTTLDHPNFWACFILTGAWR